MGAVEGSASRQSLPVAWCMAIQDQQGYSCVDVLVQALCASPARLLGQELVLDKSEEGKHGLSCETDVAYCVGNAKIIYPVRACCMRSWLNILGQQGVGQPQFLHE